MRRCRGLPGACLGVSVVSPESGLPVKSLKSLSSAGVIAKCVRLWIIGSKSCTFVAILGCIAFGETPKKFDITERIGYSIRNKARRTRRVDPDVNAQKNIAKNARAKRTIKT